MNDPQKEKPGLECPKCGCGDFRVVYTWPTFGGRILRRRECRNCGRLFSVLLQPSKGLLLRWPCVRVLRIGLERSGIQPGTNSLDQSFCLRLVVTLCQRFLHNGSNCFLNWLGAPTEAQVWGSPTRTARCSSSHPRVSDQSLTTLACPCRKPHRRRAGST